VPGKQNKLRSFQNIAPRSFSTAKSGLDGRLISAELLSQQIELADLFFCRGLFRGIFRISWFFDQFTSDLLILFLFLFQFSLAFFVFVVYLWQWIILST